MSQKNEKPIFTGGIQNFPFGVVCSDDDLACNFKIMLLTGQLITVNKFVATTILANGGGVLLPEGVLPKLIPTDLPIAHPTH
jgi:hypothetical protein